MTDRVHLEDTDLDDAMAYLVNGEYFTGEVIETSPTGQIVEMTTVVNGEEDGLQRSWYEDGTLKYEARIIKDRIDGRSRQWHPNGVLAEERKFDEKGKLVNQRTWTPDGKEVKQ